MATGGKIEVEMKFEVAAPGAGDRYLVAPELGPFTPGGPVRSVRMEDRYVDSTDWALARAGFAARLRKTTHGTEIGLKSLSISSERLQRRQEIEGPADAGLVPTDWPASHARTAILELCGDGALVELLTIRQPAAGEAPPSGFHARGTEPRRSGGRRGRPRPRQLRGTRGRVEARRRSAAGGAGRDSRRRRRSASRVPFQAGARRQGDARGHVFDARGRAGHVVGRPGRVVRWQAKGGSKVAQGRPRAGGGRRDRFIGRGGRGDRPCRIRRHRGLDPSPGRGRSRGRSRGRRNRGGGRSRNAARARDPPQARAAHSGHRRRRQHARGGPQGPTVPLLQDAAPRSWNTRRRGCRGTSRHARRHPQDARGVARLRRRVQGGQDEEDAPPPRDDRRPARSRAETWMS